jgi:hypothetical protein
MIRLAAVALMAALAVGAPTLANASSRSAQGTAPTVHVLASDGKYLVYQRDGIESSIHVMAKDGSRRRLDIVPNTLSSFELVGSILSAPDPRDGAKVYWWNLADYTSGQFTLQRTDDVYEFSVGSAPQGIVVARDDRTWSPDGYPSADQWTVYLESTDGMITTLGMPFADNPDTFGGMSSGPYGAVAVRSDTTQTYYVRYDGGGFVPLANVGSRDSEGWGCLAVTRYFAQCRDDGSDGDGTLRELLPLDGVSSPIKVNTEGPLVAVNRRGAYGTKRIHFVYRSGKTIRTAIRGTAVAGAFEDLVYTNAGHTKLFSLAGPHAKPKLLVS